MNNRGARHSLPPLVTNIVIVDPIQSFPDRDKVLLVGQAVAWARPVCQATVDIVVGNLSFVFPGKPPYARSAKRLVHFPSIERSNDFTVESATVLRH